MISAGDAILDAFEGSWSTAGGFTSSADPTAALRAAFFGTRATLIVGTGPDAGIFGVKINDKLWRSIDGYAATAGERQFVILLDGIHIDLVPVLLGQGTRLFEYLGIEPIELECTSVVDAPGVTHLTYRVVK